MSGIKKKNMLAVLDEKSNVTKEKQIGVPETRPISVQVIRNLLNTEREKCVSRAKKFKSPKHVLKFVRMLINAIPTDDDKNELYDLILGLPGSVLGNDAIRQETRVFVDLKKDIRESQKISQKHLNSNQLDLAKVITGLFVQLLESVVKQNNHSEQVKSGEEEVEEEEEEEEEEGDEEKEDGKGKGKEKDVIEDCSRSDVVVSLLYMLGRAEHKKQTLEQLLLLYDFWLVGDSEREGVLRKYFYKET